MNMKKLLLLTLGLTAGLVHAATYYVDATRPDDTGDGVGWATAKQTLQAAIDIPGATEIIVADGTYAPITTDNKAITIRSENGAGVTFIDGGGITRCATLGSASGHINTVLIGFTLQNGMALSGGGALFGTLHNCILTQNTANYGGGAYGNTLNNCIVSENTALHEGGGAYYGILNNCLLVWNRATLGGGVYNGTLKNCTLSLNVASYGGGVYNGTLDNCIVWDNFVSGTTTTSNYPMALVSLVPLIILAQRPNLPGQGI